MTRRMETARRFAAAGVLVGLAAAGPSAQDVSFERLSRAAEAPADWLTYSGTYYSQRYSELDQVTAANVRDLQLQWVYQTPVFGPWQSTPLVVDGVMYLTQRPNDVVALDARTGRVFWVYSYATPSDHRACCGSNNRGVAILGNRVFMATLDAHVVALDAATGAELWDVELADRHLAYSFTLAPLVVEDKVIIGSAGGDRGIRGFITALDAATGEEVWRFHTIPGPGEPGHETWEECPPDPETYCDPEAWMHGGAAAWLTGSYDPELNLMYWGLGNPGPDFNRHQRPGDNLYSDSVVALDADTGELRWHFQFTPNDPYDYDAVQIPVLADIERNGIELKAMLWANRNGFYYVLDRETGRFLTGQPFVTVNWAEGLDDNGRPIETPQPPGAPTYPGVQGGTNWYSPSYSPRTEMMYVPAWESYASVFDAQPQEYAPGRPFVGGRPRTAEPVPDAPTGPGLTRGPLNTWTAAAGSGAVVALDALTGETRWKFEMTDVTSSGILTTASDLLFTGARSGYFQALDARTGDLLWRVGLGGQIVNGPMTYEVDGRQYVAVIAGSSLSTFALRD
ncbi:MAG: PQQ-dependent dehydrogenase, methanol/ethanol family [Acidobacteria bacterium]|nr:PQQ-dependent dehydrogenase, methanol/ethanol family [Acidobacteriota bacterium]